MARQRFHNFREAWDGGGSGVGAGSGGGGQVYQPSKYGLVVEEMYGRDNYNYQQAGYDAGGYRYTTGGNSAGGVGGVILLFIHLSFGSPYTLCVLIMYMYVFDV